MNEAEKEGCEKLLSMLSPADLTSLVDTITKKQNSVTRTSSVSEVIRAIIENSPSAIHLLKKKKVRRDLLLKFLTDQSINVPDKADKNKLIQLILEKWGTKFHKDDFIGMDDDEDESTSTNMNMNPSSSEDGDHPPFNSRNQSFPSRAQDSDRGNQSLNATPHTKEDIGEVAVAGISGTDTLNDSIGTDANGFDSEYTQGLKKKTEMCASTLNQNDRKRKQKRNDSEDESEKVINLLERQNTTLKSIFEEQKRTNEILSQLLSIKVER